MVWYLRKYSGGIVSDLSLVEFLVFTGPPPMRTIKKKRSEVVNNNNINENDARRGNKPLQKQI